MKSTMKTFITSVITFGVALSAQAGPQRPLSAYAPPPVDLGSGQLAVPSDIHNSQVAIRIDVVNKTAIATARVQFSVLREGLPMLDLIPNPTRVVFDGRQLSLDKFGTILLPGAPSDGLIRVLREKLVPGNTHTLEVSYPLGNSVGYENEGAQLGFFMTDLSSERGYMQRYAIANFEYDQHPVSVDIEVLGAKKEHQMFTNGVIQNKNFIRGKRLGGTIDLRWRIQFPPYFTASSHYMHLTNRSFVAQTKTYSNTAKTFPVTIYSSSSEYVEAGFQKAWQAFENLEKTFGPYGHPNMTIYVTPGGGGMEYSGATMTSLSALAHELCHSWYARGVMPGNGAAGWIDEATASWHDSGFQRRSSAPSGAEMAWRNPYVRQTARAAYSTGASFLGHLDFLFADIGGLRPMLAKLFSIKNHNVISTPEFQNFLERESGKNLQTLFDQVVYNKSGLAKQPLHTHKDFSSAHPRQYTWQEIVNYR